MTQLCPACRQRAYAAFKCARITELVAARRAPISFFDGLLNEAVDLQASAFVVHPPSQEWIN